MLTGFLIVMITGNFHSLPLSAHPGGNPGQEMVKNGDNYESRYIHSRIGRSLPQRVG